MRRHNRARVAIVHQGFIPTYRVAFFERLAEASDVEYVVLHGRPPAGSGHAAAQGPFRFPHREVRNRELRVKGLSVLYQPILGPIREEAFDGLVLGAELKLVANVAAGALYLARGRPVLLWGQGFEKVEDSDGARGALKQRVAPPLKRWLSRHASGYLVYTEGGAARLVESGIPRERVFPIRNTLDMGEQVALHAELDGSDEAALRERLGLSPTSVVLLYLGRVYAEKRPLELVDVLARLQRDLPPGTVEAVALGDGPVLPDMRARAAEAGVALRFLGDVRDQREVAQWLRVAAAVVIPGKVGLVVNHALAHGVPVLTRASDLHAPEVEYLQDGESGLVCDGPLDAFADAVKDFVLDPAQRERLAAGALAVRGELGLDRMVAAFDAGVRRTLGV